MMRKHLDVEKTYKAQPDNVAACEQEVYGCDHWLSVAIRWTRLQLRSLYPTLFLNADANANHRKTLARVYIQKIFANDRWRHLSGKDMGGMALHPLIASNVRKFENIAPK